MDISQIRIVDKSDGAHTAILTDGTVLSEMETLNYDLDDQTRILHLGIDYEYGEPYICEFSDPENTDIIVYPEEEEKILSGVFKAIDSGDGKEFIDTLSKTLNNHLSYEYSFPENLAPQRMSDFELYVKAAKQYERIDASIDALQHHPDVLDMTEHMDMLVSERNDVLNTFRKGSMQDIAAFIDSVHLAGEKGINLLDERFKDFDIEGFSMRELADAVKGFTEELSKEEHDLSR